METEILQATNLHGENQAFYEVEKIFLTWKERKQQVKNNKHELVYCLFENVRTFNHGQGLVATWYSIGKSSWGKCRRVIRKINTTENI